MKNLVLILLLCGQSFAAIVGVLETKMNQCSAVAPMMETLKHVPAYPSDWRIFIACNEVVWKHIKILKNVQGTDTAFSSADGEWTVVNAAVFDTQRLDYSSNTPENVLKHELGHIKCKCGSEKEANRAGRSQRVSDAE
jgi:hypothetical protein